MNPNKLSLQPGAVEEGEARARYSKIMHQQEKVFVRFFFGTVVTVIFIGCMVALSFALGWYR